MADPTQLASPSTPLRRAGGAREVDAIADQFVTDSAALNPELATSLGLPGADDRWSDYSPEGYAARAALLQATIARLHTAAPADAREDIAKEAMLERLGLDLELSDARITTSRVSVIAGHAQEIRSTFDLMPTDTPQAWEHIAARLHRVGGALHQVRQTLRTEAVAGNVSAVRQIRGTVEQIEQWCGRRGTGDFFAGLVRQLPENVDDRLRAQVQGGADAAREAFADFGRWLATDLAPRAPSLDAVGEERYGLDSRYFLGASIDLTETYAWGWAELARIRSEQRETARLLTGEPDVRAAYAALDADPARKIAGAERFRDWMQELADQALTELAGTHFDIPDPIRVIECCLAPTHDGGIYYTAPAEDWSRPGRMWWAVPEGIDDFSTWKEVTTVYHEGVPGHHLQVAQNAYRAELLNRWQRQMCFVSGHGEGWALYAERLMDELGYLADPGNRMGMLDAQAFRAARVVLDIGLHLQLRIPADNPMRFRPGEHWTPAAGLDFLRATGPLDEPTLRFELDRYLGWPGQAPSYKVGERIWLAARAEARARKGADFDLRRFHADALDIGPLGLDQLRRVLARL